MMFGSIIYGGKALRYKTSGTHGYENAEEKISDLENKIVCLGVVLKR